MITGKDAVTVGYQDHIALVPSFIAQGAADRDMTLQQRGDDIENQWRLVLTVQGFQPGVCLLYEFCDRSLLHGFVSQAWERISLLSASTAS